MEEPTLSRITHARICSSMNYLFILIILKNKLAEETGIIPDPKREKYLSGFYNQLINGIKYYREMDFLYNGFSEQASINFLNSLNVAEKLLTQIFEPNASPA